MLHLLSRILLGTFALLLTAYLVSGVEVIGPYGAVVTAIIHGLLHAIVRPILFVLTLPIAIVTLVPLPLFVTQCKRSFDVLTCRKTTRTGKLFRGCCFTATVFAQVKKQGM